jgi:hypothetical protein
MQAISDDIAVPETPDVLVSTQADAKQNVRVGENQNDHVSVPSSAYVAPTHPQSTRLDMGLVGSTQQPTMLATKPPILPAHSTVRGNAPSSLYTLPEPSKLCELRPRRPSGVLDDSRAVFQFSFAASTRPPLLPAPPVHDVPNSQDSNSSGGVCRDAEDGSSDSGSTHVARQLLIERRSTMTLTHTPRQSTNTLAGRGTIAIMSSGSREVEDSWGASDYECFLDAFHSDIDDTRDTASREGSRDRFGSLRLRSNTTLPLSQSQLEWQTAGLDLSGESPNRKKRTRA